MVTSLNSEDLLCMNCNASLNCNLKSNNAVNSTQILMNTYIIAKFQNFPKITYNSFQINIYIDSERCL